MISYCVFNSHVYCKVQSFNVFLCVTNDITMILYEPLNYLRAKAEGCGLQRICFVSE
jgi:hypothetical protein